MCFVRAFFTSEMASLSHGTQDSVLWCALISVLWCALVRTERPAMRSGILNSAVVPNCAENWKKLTSTCRVENRLCSKIKQNFRCPDFPRTFTKHYEASRNVMNLYETSRNIKNLHETLRTFTNSPFLSFLPIPNPLNLLKPELFF